MVGDTESCNGRGLINCGWNNGRIESLKVEVYYEILSRLRELNVPEVTLPYFEDELWVHFNTLPTRLVAIHSMLACLLFTLSINTLNLF
jgi:hypothetical protein